MSETENEKKQHPLHVLCSACGHMGCEHLANRLRSLEEANTEMGTGHAALRAAALDVLKASELGVSEEEGVRRMKALAKLVGYDPGKQPPPAGIARDDLGRAAAETERLYRALQEELGPYTPWQVALFLFTAPAPGAASAHVIAAADDQGKALQAVGRWVRERIMPKGKSPGRPS